MHSDFTARIILNIIVVAAVAYHHPQKIHTEHNCEIKMIPVLLYAILRYQRQEDGERPSCTHKLCRRQSLTFKLFCNHYRCSCIFPYCKMRRDTGTHSHWNGRTRTVQRLWCDTNDSCSINGCIFRDGPWAIVVIQMQAKFCWANLFYPSFWLCFNISSNSEAARIQRKAFVLFLDGPFDCSPLIGSSQNKITVFGWKQGHIESAAM